MFLDLNWGDNSINLYYCHIQAFPSDHCLSLWPDKYTFDFACRTIPISHSTANIWPDILQRIQWKANDIYSPQPPNIEAKNSTDKYDTQHTLSILLMCLHLSLTQNKRPSLYDLDHRNELNATMRVRINQSLWCVQMTWRCERLTIRPHLRAVPVMS